MQRSKRPSPLKTSETASPNRATLLKPLRGLPKMPAPVATSCLTKSCVSWVRAFAVKLKKMTEMHVDKMANALVTWIHFSVCWKAMIRFRNGGMGSVEGKPLTRARGLDIHARHPSTAVCVNPFSCAACHTRCETGRPLQPPVL